MSSPSSGTWRTWLSTTLLIGGMGFAQGAQADDVVDHLTRHGGMRRRTASTVVKKVSKKMGANAARGGNDYDRIRQAIGVALFGPSGAGSTLEEYNARLAQVLAKLDAGLDLWTLSALFGSDSMANCRQDFGLSAKDCRSMSKAAGVAPVVDVDGLLAEARTAFQSGNYSRAAEAYEQVTLARPSEAAAFAGLGQSRIRIGDGRGAVDALRRAIELAPNVANLRAYLGRALMASGDRGGAAAAFQSALSLNANHADAKAGLRELETAPASRPTAVASSAPSAPNAPRFGTPRFAPSAAPAAAPPSSGGFGGARFGAAAPPVSTGSNPVAMQWVKKGESHLQARQFTQALSAFQMGASFDPSYAPAFAGIGAASLGAGDRAGAARAFQTAVRLSPESADYHAALGNALAANGDRETATAAYRRALSIVPGHRAATAGLAQLEGGNVAAPTAVAAATPPAAPAPATPARFGTPRVGATAVSTVAVAPQAPARPAPAATPMPAPEPEPEPEPVAAVVEATPEPEPVAEEPAAPEPTAEEDDLIAGLLSDPLGPTPARNRSRATGGAPAPSSGGSGGGARGAAAATPSDSGALPQTPSREQVAAVMRDLKSTVQACLPDQTGTISVQMTITGATGEVTDASLVGQDPNDPSAICVTEVVRGATFPRFAKDALSIKFPFQL